MTPILATLANAFRGAELITPFVTSKPKYRYSCCTASGVHCEGLCSMTDHADIVHCTYAVVYECGLNLGVQSGPGIGGTGIACSVPAAHEV